MSLLYDKKDLTLLEGKITLKVPLAIGTLQWGTTWVDHNLVNSKGVIAEPVAQEIVDILTSSCGQVTLFDTAEGYGGGTSEKRCGRLLQDKPDIVFMTKFLPAPWRLFHSDFEHAVRDSCRRLQVSCIPVYLLHSPVHSRPIEYWIEAGAICHQKGLIQSMGLSNWYVSFPRRRVHVRCCVPYPLESPSTQPVRLKLIFIVMRIRSVVPFWQERNLAFKLSVIKFIIHCWITIPKPCKKWRQHAVSWA